LFSAFGPLALHDECSPGFQAERTNIGFDMLTRLADKCLEDKRGVKSATAEFRYEPPPDAHRATVMGADLEAAWRNREGMAKDGTADLQCAEAFFRDRAAFGLSRAERRSV